MFGIVNIYSKSNCEIARRLSNFYPNRFVFDGQTFPCFESFLQCLKFSNPDEQLSLASMCAKEAKEKGQTWDWQMSGYPYWKGQASHGLGTSLKKRRIHMDNKPFTFRRYKDEDADVLYEEYVKYALENIQPYFWGPSVIPERSKFLEGIQDYSNKVYRAPLIADECDRLFGIYHISFHNANHYHELTLHLWDNFHLMMPVLKQLIDETLHNGQCDNSILLELPGYDVELHQAADELGLKHVGTIPLFLCHGKELHDKHFYAITAHEWFRENDV